MGFYSKVIFPRLCNLSLDNPFVDKHRRELLGNVRGNILEIGFGTGLNLAHYPEHVQRLTIVEPNAGMHRLAQERIRGRGIEIDARIQSGETLPFDDKTFDCAVSTFTLCSIEQVQQALVEVYRVLKPAGEFFFLEHGLSPEPGVRKWQRRLNWFQKLVGDGCRLDRNVKELVASTPFSAVFGDEFYLEQSPKTHGYMYRGSATK